MKADFTLQNCNMSLKLFANSNILVIGASQSGKTTSVLKIIEQKLIEPMPSKIFYLYAARQPFMDDWKDRIQFVEGLDLTVIKDASEDKLLIIDDLMLSLNKDLAHHFIAGSSHKRTTTIFITHAIFLNNDFYRLISSNSHYMMLFYNKRNYSQIVRLARQVLGSDSDLLLEAYKRLDAYEFVLLSFHQRVPRELLIITDFFAKCPSVFLRP